MPITFYHNPRCSKSRAALALLNERHAEVAVVEYLKTPPDTAKLRRLVKLLGVKPRLLLRTREEPYRELSLDDPDASDETILAAIAKYPILLERPIAVACERAVIGRPPERVLELL